MIEAKLNSNQMNKPHILLLSGYHTDSHANWCQWMINHLTNYRFTLLSLSGKFFRFRIRTNPLSLFNEVALTQKYDGIIATSMIDVASMKALFPNLAKAPWLYYLHENQFVYPLSSSQHSSIDPQMVQLYSLLASEVIAFNSEFNRSSCLQGIHQLLARFPEKLELDLDNNVTKKSSVIPVPLDIQKPTSQAKIERHDKAPLKIVWNHRWEYDKGPDLLAALCKLVDQSSMRVQLTLMGKRFRNVPPPIRELLNNYHWVTAPDYLPARSDYLNELKTHDIALSTAHHEFQGLAVQEAMAMGCIPLAPGHLAYPEYVPAELLYKVDANLEQTAENILSKLKDIATKKIGSDLEAHEQLPYGNEILAHYDNLLQQLVDYNQG